MTAIRRFLADLLTFGLVRQMAEDHRREQENLRRLQRGEARQPQRNPISNTVFPERRTERRRP